MTDPVARGRRARWGSAAVIAPVSAVAFTGATVWAVGHDPLATTAPTGAAVAAAPVADPDVAALQQAVAAARAEVAGLTARTAALRARATKLSAAAKALRTQAAVLAAGSSSGGSSSGGSTSGGSSSGGSSSGGSSSGGSSGGSGSRTVVTVPAPAAPPASNGTTGASGG